LGRGRGKKNCAETTLLEIYMAGGGGNISRCVKSIKEKHHMRHGANIRTIEIPKRERKEMECSLGNKCPRRRRKEGARSRYSLLKGINKEGWVNSGGLQEFMVSLGKVCLRGHPARGGKTV